MNDCQPISFESWGWFRWWLKVESFTISRRFGSNQFLLANLKSCTSLTQPDTLDSGPRRRSFKTLSLVKTSTLLNLIENCALDDPGIAICLYSIWCHVPSINDGLRRVFKLMLSRWRSQPMRWRLIEREQILAWLQSINLKSSLNDGWKSQYK